MPRVKRTPYVVFSSRDYRLLDIDLLLAGEAALRTATRLSALSILTAQEVEVTLDEVALAHSIPSDRWVEAPAGAEETVESLAARGILVSDDDEEPYRGLRQRDELLASSGWNLYAALYHFFTRWRDVDLRANLERPDEELSPLTAAEIDAFIAQRGAPPGAFHSVDGPLAVQELPPVRRSHGLYDVLARRRTARGFDPTVPVELEELAALLYYVFGCHGYSEVRPELAMLKRTSPSAGGLHPVEAYPLIAHVADVDPGIYHYAAREHALELIEPLSPARVSELTNQFVCGQTYFAAAHVLFVLTARFSRNHWKYRYHQHALSTILMDVGHLSQTLYLVGAELDLATFFTAAVNTALVDERLGLDGCTEGTLAIAGCGAPSAARSPFDPVFAPYEPPRDPAAVTYRPAFPTKKEA